MLANELRIGNYVECSDVIHYIDELRNNGAHTFCLYPYDSRKYNVFEGHVYYKNLNPIPLTEQWLKDFGLELSKGKEIKIELPSEEYCGGTYAGYDYIDEIAVPIARVKYVHSLQNLYFALCGTELKLNRDVERNK